MATREQRRVLSSGGRRTREERRVLLPDQPSSPEQVIAAETAARAYASFARHFSPATIAEIYAIDRKTVERMFKDEPEVLSFSVSHNGTVKRRQTMRIPENVLTRVIARYTRKQPDGHLTRSMCRHFSPNTIAEIFAIDRKTVERMFKEEPGVLAFSLNHQGSPKRRISMRIPEDVLLRVTSQYRRPPEPRKIRTQRFPDTE